MLQQLHTTSRKHCQPQTGMCLTTVNLLVPSSLELTPAQFGIARSERAMEKNYKPLSFIQLAV